MARTRRRNDNAVQVFIDLVALLPWWGGVLLAAASYPALHALTQRAAPPAGARPGEWVMHATVVGLASAGQYLVPLIGLLAAGLSYWRRRSRQALVRDVAQADSAQSLNDMAWQQFEQLVGEAFRRRGYGVQETGSAGPDGGVDLVLTRHGEQHLVQCKQWRALKVSVTVVRELYGVMAARGAAGGFVVTSGRFTDEAQDFAKGRHIELIDGPQLHQMIQAVMWTKPTAAATQATEPVVTRLTPSAEAPACPVCGGGMVKRVARKGANAGRGFWGCAGFPSCRGTR